MKHLQAIAFGVLALVMALPEAWAQSDLRALRSRGELLGWEAVGRVQLGGSGYCTGVLVTKQLVLTAAHCVYDSDTGRAIPVNRIQFEAGYVAGGSLASRHVDRVVVDAQYQSSPGKHIQGQMMLHDVALLRLSQPISPSEAQPFAVYSDPKPGDRVSVLSYGKGRSEHLSWQKSCSVLDRWRGLMSFDCDVTFGSSGAPVFVRYGNRARILSLISAVGPGQDGVQVAFGMELPTKVAELKRRMANGDLPSVRVGNGAKRITVGSRKANSGAKFIRVD